MKITGKALLLFLATVMVVGTWNFVSAETISKTGMSQGALYNYLNSVQTLLNEVKSDHNVVMGSYSSTRAMVNALKTQHNTVMASYSSTRAQYNSLQTKYNALFASYSALNARAATTGGFTSYTGTQKLVVGNQRVSGSTDATVLTGARATASSDTTVVTGARTTSSAISFSGN